MAKNSIIKQIGGTEKVPLTEGLLNLIIMVQSYETFLLAKNMYEKSHDENSVVTSRYKEAKRFFNSLDDEILARYKLSKNFISFEKILRFDVTNEIRSTLFEELPKKFLF